MLPAVARTMQGAAQKLSSVFGKGFSADNLRNFRQFYRTYIQDEIRSTPWSELG